MARENKFPELRFLIMAYDQRNNNSISQPTHDQRNHRMTNVRHRKDRILTYVKITDCYDATQTQSTIQNQLSILSPNNARFVTICRNKRIHRKGHRIETYPTVI